MSTNQPQKVFKKNSSAEKASWDYFEEGYLTNTYSAVVCITCQNFDHSLDKYFRTVLNCKIQQHLIPDGEHLTSSCSIWSKRNAEEKDYLLRHKIA